MANERLYQTFAVNRRGRAAVLDFIEGALRASRCTVISRSEGDRAPFRFSFATPWGERMGLVAYAFTANSKVTKNRPANEHRFQVKYGSKDGRWNELWQDPFGLYTTLFLGINVERGFFVGADPVLNSPTRFFVSKEFKESHAVAIERSGWHAWERERLIGVHEPVEVLVGGDAEHLLRFICFEREVRGEDQGHRQLAAEQFGALSNSELAVRARRSSLSLSSGLTVAERHTLEREFDLSSQELLDLIVSAPRLKMAVRGWVAETHLRQQLGQLPGVESVDTLEEDGRPDFAVRMSGGNAPVLVECKNVLRSTDRSGCPRLDFMRTRSSQGDACSRFYSTRDFDVVAACLHARTERWEFSARLTRDMPPHARCPSKLANRVVIDHAWTSDIADVLRSANR